MKTYKLILNTAGFLIVCVLAGCTSTPIQQSLRQGNSENTMKLIAKGSGLNQEDKSGHTPLMCAVTYANLDTVKALIGRGAEVNHVNRQGTSALSIAVGLGKSDMVHLLVSKGANVNQTAGRADSILSLACSGGNLEIVEVLLNSGAQAHPIALLEAARSGRGQVVEFILGHGSDFKLNTNSLNESLVEASQHGHSGVVELLLNHNADVNARIKQGKLETTPLHAAVASDHRDICITLIRAGARLNQKDENGNEPLALALSEPQLELAAVLIDAGATFESKTNTTENKFCWGVYQKLVADKAMAENRKSVAKEGYSSAVKQLGEAKAGFLQQAKTDTKKAASREFWASVLLAAAQGMAGGAASYNSYGSYQSMAQMSALRNSSSVAQYNANYSAAMSAYRPPPVNYSYTPNVGSASGVPANGRLRREAASLKAKAGLCDELIAKIEPLLKNLED